MAGNENDTRSRLISACIQVITTAHNPRDVSVRAIAAAAGTGLSAVYSHFASLDDLVIVAAKRLYAQINHERLSALQQAADAARPDHPAVRDVLAALVGPPVRWSLDPTRPYAVFRHVNRMQGLDGAPPALRSLIDQVEQYRVFITYLHRAAPWWDEVEIGWRVNAALGVRTQVLREARRTRLLTQGKLDLTDPDRIIELILDVVEPMFLPRERLATRLGPHGSGPDGDPIHPTVLRP